MGDDLNCAEDVNDVDTSTWNRIRSISTKIVYLILNYSVRQLTSGSGDGLQIEPLFGGFQTFGFLVVGFLVVGFLVVGFLVVGFLVVGFLVVGFLVVGLLVVGVLVVGLLVVGILVVGFLVVGVLVVGFLVVGFLVVDALELGFATGHVEALYRQTLESIQSEK